MNTLIRYIFLAILVVSVFVMFVITIYWLNRPDPDISFLSKFLAIALATFLVSYFGEKTIMEKITKEDEELKNLKEFTIHFSHIKHITIFLFLFSMLYFLYTQARLENLYEKWVISIPFMLIATLLQGSVLFFRSGDPKLKIVRKGIFIGGYGMIPWSSVDGIHATFQERVGCIVQFKIKNIDSLQRQMDFLAKIASKIRQKNFKDVITVRVGGRASQRSVADLAINLWTEATGKQNLWHPGMSDQLMSTMQRQPQLLADLKAAAQDNNPELLKTTMENIDRDLEIVKQHAEKNSKEAKKSLWILAAISIAYFVFMTMKYLASK